VTAAVADLVDRGQHAPHNAMEDPAEIARFHDRCSELMRSLLDALAAAPDRPRPLQEIEDALGWPQRRQERQERHECDDPRR
jgi:hypothetical protein